MSRDQKLVELIALIKEGDVEKLMRALDDEGLKKVVNAPSPNGESPIHIAAQARNAKIIQVLLVNGANANRESEEKGNHLGYTAAHYAAANGDIETLTALASFNADFNRPSADRWYPLHVAAYKSKQAAMALLIEKGANVNCVNNFGQTPLVFAVSHGRLSDVRFLLKQKADTKLDDPNQDSLLHHALHYQMSKVFKGEYKVPESQLDVAVLLVLNNVKPDAKNSDDREATFYIQKALPSLQPVLQLLSEHAAKFNQSKTEWNYLTLAAAKEKNFMKIGFDEASAKELVGLMSKLDSERLELKRSVKDKTASDHDAPPSESKVSASIKATMASSELHEPLASKEGHSVAQKSVGVPEKHPVISLADLRAGKDPSNGKCPFFQHGAKSESAAASPKPNMRDMDRPLCPFSWAFVYRHQTTFLLMIASFVFGMWADQLINRIVAQKAR